MKIDEEKRVLTADDGFILTNGAAYGKEVMLGDWDGVENWREITAAEYGKILEEQERSVLEHEQH